MTCYHVYPVNDWIDHKTEGGPTECDCPCEPVVKWIDDETGLPLAWPLVVHNALDGRE